MSDSRENRMWRWTVDHRWLVVGTMFYGACLSYVLTTIGFAEEREVRQFIAQAPAQAAHEPTRELPAMRTVQWPDITPQRDPFQHP